MSKAQHLRTKRCARSTTRRDVGAAGGLGGFVADEALCQIYDAPRPASQLSPEEEIERIRAKDERLLRNSKALAPFGFHLDFVTGRWTRH